MPEPGGRHSAERRGGARNSRWRTSERLTEQQCRSLIDAAMTAERIGCPFNRFITIAWERAGVAGVDNAATTGRLIKLAADWLRERGHRLRWAWVQEWSQTNRAHVHILLHIPPKLDSLFRTMPLRWVKRCLPGPYPARTLQTQAMQFSDGVGSDAAAYRANVMGKVHYVLKAASAELEATLGMAGAGHKPWGQACVVYGKRMGIWQGWRSDGRDPRSKK